MCKIRPNLDTLPAYKVSFFTKLVACGWNLEILVLCRAGMFALVQQTCLAKKQGNLPLRNIFTGLNNTSLFNTKYFGDQLKKIALF
jgi:hypothetical protein